MELSLNCPNCGADAELVNTSKGDIFLCHVCRQWFKLETARKVADERFYDSPLHTAVERKVRWRVFARDGFKCRYCGVRAPDAELRLDHATPCAGRGKWDLRNFVTSCKKCNAQKQDKLLEDACEVKAGNHRV